jgi:hypothetical protein
MSETVKAISDSALNITLIIVGISDNVADLVQGHESILRCSEEILMPRMNNEEMKELLEKRIFKLGMSIEGNAKWKIINLSKGLPAFAHSHRKKLRAFFYQASRLKIVEADVDDAILELLKSLFES